MAVGSVLGQGLQNNAVRRNCSLFFSARQRGVALLIFMLFVFLAATAWTLGQSRATGLRRQIDETTAAAMAQAKETLIGRAVTDGNRPGSLPCPDGDNDGVADLFAGQNCPAYVGHLPWKTLDLPELVDGYGDRLWYAISPGLRDHPAVQPLNYQSALQLTFDASPNIAAIVFSPGPSLATQNGRPSDVVADYLDGANSDGDSAYVSGPLSPTFNDKALAITRDDLFRTVNQRILAEIRGPDDNPAGAPTYGLRRYWADNGFFPWADSASDGFGDAGITIGSLPFNDLLINPAALIWLNPNGWLPLVTYQRLGPNLARIGIVGSGHTMDIIPCPSSPCP